MQLKIFDTDPATVTASQICPGQCFLHNDQIFMRVKPTGFLLNSTLINDLINRNEILRVNVQTGVMFITAGDTPVIPMDATVTVKRKV